MNELQNWELLERLDINLHNKRHGSIKTTCPRCSESRRNKKDPCLSVNIDEGVYNCHHCDFNGKVFNKIPKREYFKPLPRLEKVEQTTSEWFEKQRGISNNTLLRFKVTDSNEWMPKAQKEVSVICFNYYRNGDLVNVKFRAKNKDFKLVKDAELIFYNLDALNGVKEAIICEGEIDAMSLYEAGFYNVVSVPNGASKGSQKLEYLDNCWKYFEDKEKIILLTDGDEAGYSLRDELARRLGKERCFKVSYPDGCKDSNEVLLKHGKTALINLVNGACEFPIEGILSIGEDLIDDIYTFWEHGFPKGIPLGIQGLDEYVLFQAGQYTTVTGIPGSGKSEFVDNIAAHDIKSNGNRWGIVSFENQPASIHATKIMQKIVGKSFAFRLNPESRMTQEEFERSLLIAHDHVIFINIQDIDLTMDGIIEKARELVKRKGIKRLIIDPWNYIEHNRPTSMSETEYVSISLTKLKTFCIQTDVHAFLIAHPTKLKKENGKFEIATMYSISGSAHFFNKTDNGMSVYRDFDTDVVTVYIQKVRYEWNGRIGYCQFNFNKDTRQYTPIIS